MFKCGICGKEYDDLTSYVNCVTSCAAVKNEEELNKMLKRVKDAIDTFNGAKVYLDLCLNEFKSRFPEEYTKFYPTIMPTSTDSCCGNNDCCECEVEGDNCSCKDEKHNDVVNNFYMKFDTSNGESTVEAKINGEPVETKDVMKLLMENPEVAHLARFFGDL